MAIFFQSFRQDFDTCIGNQQRFFELGRQQSVHSNRSPFVWPGNISPISCNACYVQLANLNFLIGTRSFCRRIRIFTLINHRFDSETMTRLHNTDDFIFCNQTNKSSMTNKSVLLMWAWNRIFLHQMNTEYFIKYC